MDIYTTDELQKLLPKVISDVVGTNSRCTVTTKHGNAILLSEESYQNLLVTLEFLSTPGLMNNINLDMITEELALNEAFC